METGKSLGNYKIVSSIGAGGMGEVYRAHDSRLDREVAIKLLPHRSRAELVHGAERSGRRQAVESHGTMRHRVIYVTMLNGRNLPE